MTLSPSITHKPTHALRLALLASLLCASCQQDSHQQPQPSDQPGAISISALPAALGAEDSRTAFEDGDQVGLYVVNRVNGKMTSLLPSGNYIDNARFTYHGAWTPSQPLYWLDDDTRADLYLYYPHTSQMTDPRYWVVNVPTDQSTETAMHQADVLVGRMMNVEPTTQAVDITARHMMSRLTITLQPGKGMTEELLRKADVEVMVNGLITEGTVNIATALVTASGTERHDIRACQTDALTFAITAVPQTVSEGDLITIVVNGDRYTLRRGLTLAQGTSHHATVRVNTGNGGIGVSIAGWATDDTDYGGAAQ